jgi:phosphate transport system protein
MAVRTDYKHKLDELYLGVVSMATYVVGALQKAASAFSKQDTALADQVIVEEERINHMALDLDDRCVSLIAREQPVAHDLREIVTTTKVVSNLERIGDHAVRLAKFTKRLAGRRYSQSLDELLKMAQLGITMVQQAAEAFREQNPGMARSIAEKDDKIDELHEALVQKYLRTLYENKDAVEECTAFLFVARFLERMGDHAVNICEWIVFGAEGEHVELND